MGMSNVNNGVRNNMMNRGSMGGGSMGSSAASGSNTQIKEGAEWTGEDQYPQDADSNAGQQGGMNGGGTAPVNNNPSDTVQEAGSEYNAAWIIGSISAKPNVVRTGFVPTPVANDYWTKNAEKKIKSLTNKTFTYIKADGTEDTSRQKITPKAEKPSLNAFRCLFKDEYMKMRDEEGFFQPVPNESKTQFYVVRYFPTQDMGQFEQLRLDQDLGRFAHYYNKEKHVALLRLHPLYKFMGACKTQKMHIAGPSVTGKSKSVPKPEDEVGIAIVHTHKKDAASADSAMIVQLVLYYRPSKNAGLDYITSLAQIPTLPRVFLYDNRDDAAMTLKKTKRNLYLKTEETEIDEINEKTNQPTGKKIKETHVQNVYQIDKFQKIFPNEDITQLCTPKVTKVGATASDKKAAKDATFIAYEDYAEQLSKMGIEADDLAKIKKPSSRSSSDANVPSYSDVVAQKNSTLNILQTYAQGGTFEDAAKKASVR